MMTIYPVEGTPFWDFPGNYLPPTAFQTSSPAAYLSGPASGTPLQVAQNYLSQNKAALGLSAADLTHYNVTDNYTDEDTGVTHIYLQQTFNGLPIADAVGSVHITANGEVVSASANFVPNLTYPATNQPLAPEVSSVDALNAFASALSSSTFLTITNSPSVAVAATGRSQKTIFNDPELSLDPIPVELQYVASPDGGVELTWSLVARSPRSLNWFVANVAAEGGRTGSVVRVADWIANASYNVFAAPVQDPLYGSRSIVTDPHSIHTSPFGWHDSNGTPAPDFTDTRGNNVIAQEDLDGNDLGGLRPQGGPTLNFDFPLNLGQSPLTYTNASVTNMFYWLNISHDVSANHGFTEQAGNFQITNYSGKGLGNDPVLADAQDFGGIPVALGGLRNNAFFGTPPDGQSGFTGMFLFDTSISTGAPIVPERDGALAADVVAHEFAHGISNRLTGGPANAFALQSTQSGGMGEGWSDWFGLLLTARPTDNRNTPRSIATWLNGDNTVPGTGIRRVLYSYDMTIDPHTLNDYNGDSFPQQNNSEVHNSGEIWASALWDMTWNLIDKYGFSTDLYRGNGGQNVAMDIVLLGMKLQPANPTFIQARDAIVTADKLLTGGQNFAEIWTAFARRGFGRSATAGIDANALTVSGTFDTPTIPVIVSGTIFNDADGDGTRDAGEAALSGWTVYNDANNNGVLDTGEPRTVSSASGSYTFTFFSNQTVRLRQVVMPNWQVTAPPGGVHVLNVSTGQSISNVNFGNQMIDGRVSGIKFNDLDGDGTLDAGEPGIEGVVIYVDMNKDGKIGIMEPAAVTDRFGRYTIVGVRPGTYNIREVFQPGMIQTFPDPAGTALGAHLNVVVASNQTTLNINFGNRTALDFGDAPTAGQSGFAQSYPVTLAQNGARHGILPGFGLGVGAGATLVDAEADGQPSSNAAGDGADENGVLVSGLTPGLPASATVTVSLGGFSAGVLQGFIDWNRDGDWNDAGEQIFKDLALGAGTTTLPFTVPTGLTLGPTFARFRYGYERGIGPAGAAMAGEVEDYQVTVLANVPVASNDNFGAAFGTQLVKEGSTGNVLDVLANDFGVTLNGTTFAPDIKTSTFPATTSRGSTLSVQMDTTLGRNVVLYTPAAGVIGIDTFQYQVTAGGLDSNFATVQIDVTASDPRALDDSFTLNAALATGAQQLAVLANDVPATGLTVTDAQTLTTGLPANTFVANGNTVTFNPPAGFRGTIIGQYTADDTDPLTNPTTARITVQLLNFVGGAPDPTSATTTPYLAQLTVEVLDVATGDPITMIGEDSEFLLRVSAFDLRAGGSPASRGVEAAFLDLLYNSSFAAPIPTPGGFFPFNIVFNGQRQQVTASSVQASTVSSVTGDASLSDVNGFYNNMVLTFFGGNVNGQQVRVLNYNGATRTFTFATPLTVAPAVGTQFEISDAPAGPTSSVTAAASATSFSGGLALNSTDDFYSLNNDFNVVFTSGPLTGQSGNVIDYIGASRTFMFAPNTFTAAPNVGDTFRIESALYSRARSGAANSPAPGAIDEVGGAHLAISPAEPVGSRPAAVFTVRMRATSQTPLGQPLLFVGDPADSPTPVPDPTKVLLFNPTGGSPIELTDEQVFIKSPPGLTILGPGEGEFTNLRNPLDVNTDGHVSPLDALMVLNDVNAYGGRSLSQLGLGTSGALPPQNFLDVNFDSYVSPLDALLVLNYLNSSLASSGASGEGEFASADAGEGEAPGAIDGSLLAALTTVLPPGGATEESGDAAPVAAPVSSTATAVRSTHAPAIRRTATEDRPLARRIAQLEEDAADEVFSALGQFRPIRLSRR